MDWAAKASSSPIPCTNCCVRPPPLTSNQALPFCRGSRPFATQAAKRGAEGGVGADRVEVGISRNARAERGIEIERAFEMKHCKLDMLQEAQIASEVVMDLRLFRIVGERLFERFDRFLKPVEIAIAGGKEDPGGDVLFVALQAAAQLPHRFGKLTEQNPAAGAEEINGGVGGKPPRHALQRLQRAVGHQEPGVRRGFDGASVRFDQLEVAFGLAKQMLPPYAVAS